MLCDASFTKQYDLMFTKRTVMLCGLRDSKFRKYSNLYQNGPREMSTSPKSNTIHFACLID